MTERREQPKKGGRSRQAITKREQRRAAKPTGKGMAIALVPTLRDRLFREMDGARIPKEGRLQFLCSMTGRKPQTARRWIDMEKPGLPDLASFAAICGAFDTDANWMLGLSKTRYALPRESGEPTQSGTAPNEKLAWINSVAGQVAEEAEGCDTLYMRGDDMEPGIKSGAPLLVDTRIREITGNGTYVLEYQGRTLIRNVETRIGEGLVLSCENPKYKPTLLKDPTTAKRMGLRVIGRVRIAILAQRL